MKTICILGLGYIGLPTASMFATHGMRVIGVDINSHVVEVLNGGDIHIKEAGLKAVVQEAMASGRLVVRSAPEPADVFIVAVPTPIKPDKTADMRAVIAATESIVPYLRRGNLVVLESTSPLHTTVNLVQPILERSGLKAGQDFLLAYSPERVLPGQILKELVENARVIGGINQSSAEAVRDLYATFVKGEIVTTDATTAEMVKLMENTFRDVNIALANEFALVAERVGINVWEAIELANHHPRVRILRPGPGVGGHCIAVDPWFIVQVAPEVTSIIQTARRVNDGMPAHVVELVKQALAEQQSRRARERVNRSDGDSWVSSPPHRGRVACLGLAYKADVDDTRESPAIKVVELLRGEGFEVRAYDPHVRMGVVPEQVDSLEAALNQAVVIVVLTDHREFRQLSVVDLGGFNCRTVIDVRHCLKESNS